MKLLAGGELRQISTAYVNGLKSSSRLHGQTNEPLVAARKMLVLRYVLIRARIASANHSRDCYPRDRGRDQEQRGTLLILSRAN
jgi:hypothetical protein